MKNIFAFFAISLLFICGCYTMLSHPDVEVYYEDEQRQDSFAEQFDVLVDEDCQSCHSDFRVTRHFAPLAPAHQDEWSQIPWWFDEKYLSIFGSSTPASDSDEDEYNPVQSPVNTLAPPTPPPAYIRSPRSAETEDRARVTKPTETDTAQNSGIRNINERKSSESNRRKVRKRN